MADTLADLMREVGIEPSAATVASTPARPPLRNQSGARRPMPRQMRPPESRANDPRLAPEERQRAYTQVQRTQTPPMGEAYAPPRNQFAEAGEMALETTGVPQSYRSGLALHEGRYGEAALEGGSALLALGSLALPGARGRAPAPRAIANDARILPRRLPPSTPSETLSDLTETPFGVRRAPNWAPDEWALSQRPDGYLEPPANPLTGEPETLTQYDRALLDQTNPRPRPELRINNPPRSAPDAGSVQGGIPHRTSQLGRDIYEPSPGVEMEIGQDGLTLFTYRGNARPGGGTGAEAQRAFRGAYRALAEDATRTQRPVYRFRPETPRQAELYREAFQRRPLPGYAFSEEGGMMRLERAEAGPTTARDGSGGGQAGFDTNRVVYRGLGRPYNAADGGYYQSFTSSLDDAREYGSHVTAANLRLGRNLAVDGGGNNFNSLSVAQLPADVRAKLHPGSGAAVTTDEIAHAARAAGYDSVTVRNVHDNRWGERPATGSSPRTIDFVFDTKNVSPLDSVPPQSAPQTAAGKVRLTDADRALLSELESELPARPLPDGSTPRPPPDLNKSNRRPQKPAVSGGFLLPRR